MNQNSPAPNGFSLGGAPPHTLPPAPQQAPQMAPSFTTNAGETTLSPVAPPPSQPQWPAYPQAQAPQQQSYQQSPPQYMPQPQQPPQYAPAQQYPAYQTPAAYQPAPQQSQRPQQMPQHAMAPDPNQRAGQQYQFNDGLRLAGPVGSSGVAPAASFNAPAQAPQSPGLAGVPNTFPPQQQFAPPQQTSLRDQLAAQGYPIGAYVNDAQLLEDFGAAAVELQQFRQQQRYAAYGAQGVSSGEDLTGQQPGPAAGQAAQTATPASPQNNRPKPPEWRPEWNSLVRQDDSGLWVPIDPTVTPPAIVQRANEYHAWRRDRADQVMRDPVAVVRQEGLDEYLNQQKEAWQQEVFQRLEKERQQEQAQAQTEQFIEQNKSQLFVLDQNGQPAKSPYTQQPLRTPLGDAVYQFSQQIAQQHRSYYGTEPNPLHILAETKKYIASIAPQQQAPQQQQGFQQPPQLPAMQNQYQPQAAPQQQFVMQPAYYQQYPQQQPLPSRNEQLKDQTIQRAIANNGAMYAPNQLGTVASAAANAEIPQNSRISFGDMLKNEAVKRGLLSANM